MPLHFGRMPAWFTENMGNLTKAVFESVIQNYGKSELLTRLSDPNWLQAVGSVAGFQYNSSGVTAALFGSVRPKINPMAKELGVYILGGKGKRAWAGPQQITRVADQHGLDVVNANSDGGEKKYRQINPYECWRVLHLCPLSFEGKTPYYQIIMREYQQA